jgi:hypothetical protein
MMSSVQAGRRLLLRSSLKSLIFSISHNLHRACQEQSSLMRSRRESDQKPAYQEGERIRESESCAFDVPERDPGHIQRLASIDGRSQVPYPIGWGVGRHGPGDNIFAYFVDPFGFVIEYTAEVLQVSESYQAHGPDDWVWPPGRTDHWGIAPPKPDYVKQAQLAIRFPAERAAAAMTK